MSAYTLGIFGLFSSATAASAEESPEGIYTTNFRPGHSVSLLASFQRTRWDIEHAGAVNHQSAIGGAPGYALRYGFHFNLQNNLGMLIGTAAQAHFESRDYGKGFAPGTGIIFPSIASGLVYAFGLETRAALALEYSAAWYPWMQTTSEDNKVVSFGVIPDMVGALLQFDHFYSRTRAFTFVLGYRRITNECLGECNANSTTLVGNLNIRSVGVFVQAGVTWQPGEELGFY